MQNQPEFEARIGTTDADAMVSAQLHRFVEARVLVPIEYSPDLIAVLERILPAAASWSESEFTGTLDRLLCNRVRDSYAGMGVDLDERTPAGTLERIEVGWLSLSALEKENEAPSRIELRLAALQARNGTPSAPTPGSACHALPSLHLKAPLHSGPEDTPWRSRPRFGFECRSTDRFGSLRQVSLSVNQS